MSVFKPDIFAGKVLFCTGGSTTDGICYKQTEAMMRHGCDAALFGRRTELAKSSAEKLSTATGRKCIGVSGDVRQPESLDTAVKETLTKLGRIDFVIAGAAGILVSAIDKLSVNAFKSVIDIDLVGEDCLSRFRQLKFRRAVGHIQHSQSYIARTQEEQGIFHCSLGHTASARYQSLAKPGCMVLTTQGF